MCRPLALKEAMDLSTPRAKPTFGRKQAYWWNDTICAARKEVIKLKRAITKTHRKGQMGLRAQAEADYRIARSKLKREIMAAKSRA